MTELQITYEGPVPSKSNSYRIVSKPYPRLVKSKAVREFEQTLASLCESASGRPTSWAVAPGGKIVLRPENPVYPREQDLVCSVLHTRPHRYGPDVDNILKAVADAITLSGVWIDDAQVLEWTVRRRVRPDQPEALAIAIRPVPEGLALECPSPLSRHEWVEQRRAEEGLQLPPSIVTTYCDRCCVAIGPHCTEEEVWLLPKVRRGGLTFEVICGSCADGVALDHRYRVIDRESMRTLRRFQPVRLIREKQEEIARAYASARSAKDPSSRA